MACHLTGRRGKIVQWGRETGWNLLHRRESPGAEQSLTGRYTLNHLKEGALTSIFWSEHVRITKKKGLAGINSPSPHSALDLLPAYLKASRRKLRPMLKFSPSFAIK